MSAPVPRDELEETRRAQLIEVTIDSLADVGYVGTTLAQIARRAGVSPGLVAHYFGDKDGLLEAAFRTLSRGIATRVRAALAIAGTPRGRVQAVIDVNLAPEEFDRRTGTAWLAFWGQVLHVEGLKRVQAAYQRRMLSNLRSDLRSMIPGEEARSLAAMIAAMIDGVWLRAALSQWQEADSGSARSLLTAFVDGRLRDLTQPQGAAAASATRSAPASGAAESGSHKVSGTITVVNPATGAELAELAVDGTAQIDAAVEEASAAQKRWAALTGAERGRVLQRAAQLLRARNTELAELETRNTGKPIQETVAVDVLSGADCLEYYAGLAAGIAGEHIDLGPKAFGYTRREPLGVVAGIGAWNYPLQIACWKSAPALACGNAMIFKPAELTPLTALELERVFAAAGLPDGVFQVVQGRAETGRLLTRHRGIRKISLTGEVGTGKAVMADAAATLKQVTLELGGKSPLIVFEDAKLDNAVSGALLGNFYSAGEVCSNGTRVFVHRSIRAAFIERLRTRAAALRVGDPLDPRTQVGALISAEHMEKVLGFIARGRAQGARQPRHRGRARPRLLRRAHGVRSLPRRHGHRAPRDLRSGDVGARVLGRGRGDRARQRHRVRARGGRVHQRSDARAPRHRAAAGRDLLDQSLQHHAHRAALRRREDVGARAREWPRRARALHAAEERLRRPERRRVAVLTAAR
jgi:betaine-aldehyde dehydrogenase